MFSSRPAVHPVEAPPLTDAVEEHLPLRVRIKDIQGMPGTAGGLALRSLQFVFAAAALSVMASTSDFSSVTAFCYLVAAVILQSLWSLSLAFVDVYAILVKRCLRNPRVICLFAIGDGKPMAILGDLQPSSPRSHSTPLRPSNLDDNHRPHLASAALDDDEPSTSATLLPQSVPATSSTWTPDDPSKYEAKGLDGDLGFPNLLLYDDPSTPATLLTQIKLQRHRILRRLGPPSTIRNLKVSQHLDGDPSTPFEPKSSRQWDDENRLFIESGRL